MTIVLLAGFLLIYAAYLSLWAASSEAWYWLLPAGVAAITAVGFMLRKRWSQYLWFVIAFSVSAYWLASVIGMALSGWPYPNLLGAYIGLLPGLLLLTLCIAGSIAVHKYFRDDI